MSVGSAYSSAVFSLTGGKNIKTLNKQAFASATDVLAAIFGTDLPAMIYHVRITVEAASTSVRVVINDLDTTPTADVGAWVDLYNPLDISMPITSLWAIKSAGSPYCDVVVWY
jgi:hypothetical protein